MTTTLVERSTLTLPHHFDELRKNIEPPQHRRDAAVSTPARVREFLEDSTEFQTVHPHSRLTGSYARSTSIHDIKDVDFVVFVDAEEGDESPDPEDVLDDLFAVLRDLPDAIDRPGTTQILRRQRRSVHVHFDEEDFHLDVVPAWLRDGIDEPLWVPDREWSRWVKSHPLGYGGALSKLNAETSGKAVPLIKLVKHWRTVQMQYRRPKSYWLESLVYQHLNMSWVATDSKSYAELFTDALRSIRDRFEPALDAGRVPAIPDPMLGHNVAFNWEWPAFKSFMARLSESIGWAERALAKEQDDLDEAVLLWQKVFGADYFTDSPEARRLQHAEWIGTRVPFVTSSGAVLTKQPTDEPSVASRSHRFYGESQ